MMKCRAGEQKLGGSGEQELGGACHQPGQSGLYRQDPCRLQRQGRPLHGTDEQIGGAHAGQLSRLWL